MSLINDMLRDLEKRKQPQNSSGHEGTPVATAGRNTRRITVVVGVFLVLAVLLWFGIGIRHSEPLVSAGGVASSVTPAGGRKTVVPGGETTADHSVASVSRAVVATKNEDTTGAVTTPQPEVTPAVEISRELSALLITTSAKQTVLNLSFTQRPQYQLIERETGSLVIGLNRIQLGDEFVIPPTANSLIKRLSLVPQKKTLRLLIDLVPGTRIQSSQLFETSQQDFRLQVVFVASSLAEETKKPKVAVASTVQHIEKLQKKDPPTVAKVRKIPPVIARDKQAYQAGLTQLEAGKISAAEASFTRALLINPDFPDARLQLISLLQHQRKFAKAEEFLQQGLSQAPDSSALRKMYARQLLQGQRNREAVELLQAPPVPLMTHDLEYHALLAAALQRVGAYRSASSVYAQLVKLRPQEALWWLGMAVSLEQSGHRDEAHDAYQKALSLPGLRPDLKNYIQSRLQAL